MSDGYDPHNKVYKVGEKHFSIIDLLSSVVDDDYMVNGIPRISDLHLKVGEPVRYRLDSELQMIPDAAVLTPEVAAQLIYPMLSEEKRKDIESGKVFDVDAGYELEDGGFNFRVNVFRDRHGLAAVLRLLPPKIPAVEEIGFLDSSTWEELVELKQGLVLVTGMTGSGKSTTIASLLDYVNRSRKVRVITLEDPIEYLFKSEQALISQREVGLHVESFSKGLYSALRENPDVIYVGEMRDVETASLALSAAETGHLVFSTLHTRDTVGALTRILDMFPEGRSKELTTQLSFSLAAIISQKLVPKAEGQGRCVAMEILKNGYGFGNMVRTGKWHQVYSLMETKNTDGMMTMEQALLELFRAGKITRDDALAYANSPGNITNQLPDK